MTIWIAGAWAVSAGSAGLLATAVVLRLRTYWRTAGEPAQTSVEFSMDRYRPMATLLAEDDFEFLASQAGYKRQIGVQLRKSRRQVFRMYLRELASDFQTLHAAARQALVNSPAEHAELVGILMHQQLVFWRMMAAVELHLTLGQLGLGKVDVSGLVDAFEGMRQDLARFATPQMAAGQA